ncbi:MAG: hypothetical protein ACPGO3_09965 [Magnetospiraceae bacterium]
MPTTVTETIGVSGDSPDYTTIAAWEAALPSDLVSDDEVRVGNIISDTTWASSSVVISGQTTDSTRYPHLKVDSTVFFPGIYDGPLIYNNDRYGFVVDVTTSYARVTGLRIVNTNSQSGGGAAVRVSGGSAIVEKCFGRGKNVFLLRDATNPPRAINCIASLFDSNQSGYGYYSVTTRGFEAYNCIAIGDGTYGEGFQVHSDHKVVNCVGYNLQNAFETGTWASGSDYNASDDTTANQFTNYVTGLASADFVDDSSYLGDFHSASGSALIGAGSDQSSIFTDDVDGDTRSAWDIGYDEYASAGSAFNEAVSLAVSAGISPSAGLNAAAAMALQTVTTAGSGPQGAFAPSMVLEMVAPLAAASQAAAVGSIHLNLDGFLSAASQMMLNPSAPLQTINGLQASHANLFNETLSLATEAGLGTQTGVAFNAEITLPAQTGAAGAALGVLESTVVLPAQLGALIAAGLAAGAEITLPATLQCGAVAFSGVGVRFLQKIDVTALPTTQTAAVRGQALAVSHTENTRFAAAARPWSHQVSVRPSAFNTLVERD